MQSQTQQQKQQLSSYELLDRCPSPLMRKVVETIQKVAPLNSAVLITGSTGVGKEHVARAIHELSSRVEQPFVAVNCGAIPEGLVESELFGHASGSFTGARGLHRGAFERAAGGTILLDEVGELPLSVQVKLLRVLDGHSVSRVGDEDETPTEFRPVAATNADLGALVRANKFRRDLFYRLAVFELYVPDLHQRPDDIPYLAQYFLNRLVPSADRSLTPDALNTLLAHRWPGNVRELRSAIERAALSVGDGKIKPHHLSGIGRMSAGGETDSVYSDWCAYALDTGMTLKAARRETEKALIDAALARTQNNIAAAARLLGLHPATLYRRINYLQ